MKLEQIKNVTDTVEYMLENKPITRNSDDVLYREVCRFYNPSILKISMMEFLNRREELGCPNFETVRRSRQKIQSQRPELKADKPVKEKRKANEEVFREYAVS